MVGDSEEKHTGVPVDDFGTPEESKDCVCSKDFVPCPILFLLQANDSQ